MTRQLLRNACLPAALAAADSGIAGRRNGDLLTGDLLFENGRLLTFLSPSETPCPTKTYDLTGRILLPKLVEPHCHLDKCYSLPRLGAVGGDLHAAMAAQRADRARQTAEDLRTRAGRGLDELIAAGCDLVRSHVDWNVEATPRGEVPLAWRILGELAAERRHRVTLQRAALVSLEIVDDEDYSRALARRLVADEGVLSIFVFGQSDMAGRLERLFGLAEAFGLALDFHVDEGLAPELDGLTAIARQAIECGFQGPVLCGHACSLINRTGNRLAERLDLIRRAGLSVVSLPSTNLYLQGRTEGTPERRGITRVRELAAAGIPITFGSDNVGDAFCPIGRHDPLANLALAALAAQLDPPYGPWLKSITATGRRALGAAARPLEGIALADLLVCDAEHSAEAVAGTARKDLKSWVATAATEEG